MIERLLRLRQATLDREFRSLRTGPEQAPVRWAFSKAEMRQVTELFKLRCKEESPIVLKDERIAFARSRKSLTRCWGDVSALDKMCRRLRMAPGRILRRLVPRKWMKPKALERYIRNTTIDWNLVLHDGLAGRIAVAKRQNQTEFTRCAIEGMEALCELADRYAAEAERIGNTEVARVLSRIPRQAPASVQEALQMMRIVQFGLYLHGMGHCGLGRMDQYLWPFYKADLESGRLSRNEAKELIEEFFIDLNRDSDLYPGEQQGDNGQSLMLGGCQPETGEIAVNDLTYLILDAALETRLIDPKINLRVDSRTPLDLLELGSRLTQCGLGFPQYSNDEVVIPALVAKGYSLRDARDYSVAACWEYVIPGRAVDFVNVGAVSFPYAVDRALRDEVASGNFKDSSFRERIVADIRRQVKRLVRRREVWHPAPFLSAFFEGALEAGQDITECTRYRNIGLHGAGAANAADQMGAILTIAQYDDSSPDRMGRLRELIVAEDKNFEGFDDLRKKLINEMPKVGNADERVDKELGFLFGAFADAAEEYSTARCRIRPGAGSAHYYIKLTDPKMEGRLIEPVVGATSDGRMRNAPLASSLAPSHEARVGGIFSVFKSFTAVDYSRIMNGGPITIEFSQTVFRTPEGVKKLALLIRYFIQLRLQQLQLNVLNVEELKDALVHPERHRHLVVRVWGWSGYFCELDREFQLQIINRHVYGA